MDRSWSGIIVVFDPPTARSGGILASTPTASESGIRVSGEPDYLKRRSAMAWNGGRPASISTNRNWPAGLTLKEHVLAVRLAPKII
jgi:hypothetical protein